MKKATFAIFAIAAVSSANAFSFSDGDFAVGDYLHLAFFQHTATSANRSAVGGNPGAAMFQTIVHDGSNEIGFGRVGAFNQVFTYNPSVSGAISSVSFSADYYLDTEDALDNQSLWFSIIQNGKTFCVADVHSFAPHQWRTTASTMNAGDAQWIMFWDTGGVSFDTPDFSETGGEMKFGFITGYNLLDGASLTQRVDNFTVRTTPVPEPATMAILGLGVAGIAARRRKRA